MKTLIIALAMLASTSAYAQEDDGWSDLYNHYLDSTTTHAYSSPNWGRDTFVNTPSGEIWICTGDQFGHQDCR